MTRNRLVRWTAFNVVGAAGIGVQLGVLAFLQRVLGWNDVAAAAVAVEAAVLHNFAWHQRWTWRDRPPASPKALLGRLARFQMTNGAISLAGNVALVALFTGLLHVGPVAASVVAIAICSILNFAASEVIVFRSPSSITPVVLAFTVLLAWPAPIGARSIEGTGASAATLAAWRSYESSLDARHADAASGSFFAEDRHPGAGKWRDTVSGGGVSMMKIEAPSIPDGKIHHWLGSVFVPGVTLDAVLERLKRNAGRESEFYDDVSASKLIERTGDRARVFMKLRRTTIITVTYNTEHTIDYKRLGPGRASARSVATKIAELADAGTPNEREKPASDDSGFLWRLNAYWRYEASSGGVLIECESVSLSRAVPFVVRPVANPIVDRIARESLQRTLQTLRAVLASQQG